MSMKYETIVCPFCGNGSAHITYEENRVYQMNCTDCHNAIFHQDTSWDAAVKFFKRMEITDGTRLRELAEADRDGRLVELPCKVEMLMERYEALRLPGCDDAETYSTGYRNGHKNGQAELIEYLLGIDTDIRTDAAVKALEAQK